MNFALTKPERIARLSGDIRIGVPVIISDGAEKAVVVAAEGITSERLAELHSFHANSELVITDWRAKTLNMSVYFQNVARIAIPVSEGVRWIYSVADPSLDMEFPMKGPFNSLREGSPNIHRAGVVLAKRANLLPSVVVVPLSDAEADKLKYLNSIDAAELLDIQNTSLLTEISAARVPLEVSERSRVRVFRPKDGGEEHYAIEIGNPPRDEPVLSRLHSACFTGDIMGSLKCDCGPQLRAAMAQIGEVGAGVLLYMNQEGRGIGLANKMRAYSLQDQGFDTVEANHRLGFEDDERDFRLGAEILTTMGFDAVRLMTNNPKKVAMMEESGVRVAERVPLKVGENTHNLAYLATKAKKSGHLL